MHPEDQFWIQFGRPFGALLLVGLAFLVGRLIAPLIPDGRVKRMLYDREFGRRLQRKYTWRFSLALLAAFVCFGWVCVIIGRVLRDLS